MKITSILNERSDAPSPIQVFKSLSPLQIGVIKRIAAGRLDPFANDLSAKAHEVLDSLINLGVLDQTYDLSDTGKRIVDISSRVASKDVRDARKAGFRKELNALKAATGKRRPVEVPIEDEMGDDDNEGGEEVESDDETTMAKPRARKKPQVRELERNDFESFDKDDMKGLDDEGEYRWD